MSNSEDYSSWRLQTDGGIRYRFLGSSGDFSAESAQIVWRGLFRSQDLRNVLVELFPPPIRIGGMVYPQYGSMPGFPGVGAMKVSYRSWNGDLPGDVAGADPTAPIGTYAGFIELSVTFGSINGKNPDPSDPRTFLEINSKVSGDFIHVSPEGAKVEDDVNPVSENDTNPDEDVIIDPETGEVKFDPSDTPTGNRVPSDPKPVRTPTLDSTILVPRTDWSIKWKGIPQQYFKDVLVHRLRLCNGRVNSVPIPFLFGAKPETVLFAGFDYSESYTWREGLVDSPPIDVTMNLMEKSVVWKGTTIGHNHSWYPGEGWKRVWIRNNEFPYNHIDLNFLFKV